MPALLNQSLGLGFACMQRLPKQYEDFSRTYVKIRNAFTYPELFNYSETIVFNILSTTMELMKAIESRY